MTSIETPKLEVKSIKTLKTYKDEYDEDELLQYKLMIDKQIEEKLKLKYMGVRMQVFQDNEAERQINHNYLQVDGKGGSLAEKGETEKEKELNKRVVASDKTGDKDVEEIPSPGQ